MKLPCTPFWGDDSWTIEGRIIALRDRIPRTEMVEQKRMMYAEIKRLRRLAEKDARTKTKTNVGGKKVCTQESKNRRTIISGDTG